MFEPLVAEHRGEVVKRMGDGWLVSFGSVVDAAQCAISVQERLADHGSIKLRIGLHLGDIVTEDEDIYGDGVNIAARLQELAEPGGVLISGIAYESLVGRLDHHFTDAGEQSLKNVARPVRGWRWNIAHTVSHAPASPVTAAPPPLPDKPSIAVLPFVNMSNDPEQEFLADGITEDVTTALSKFSSLFVISRSSAFTYKNEKVSVSEIARDLGVRYVVEGSVRKSGNRVRVSAQLTEAIKGSHLWTERYDGQMDDIFDLQDQITERIVTLVAPQVEAHEREKRISSPRVGVTAWELMQKALWHTYRYSRGEFAQARSLFKQIIELDPRFALARAHYAYVLFTSVRISPPEDGPALLNEALQQANEALALDPMEPVAYLARGRAQAFSGQGELALQDMHRAIELNPNLGFAYFGLGFVQSYSFGDEEAALANFDIAQRLGPRDPTRFIVLAHKCGAFRRLGRFEEAMAYGREACHARVGIYMNELNYAVALAEAGYAVEAASFIAKAIELQPDLSLEYIRRVNPNRHPDSLDSLIEAARKAGLRETVDG